tara:strand:- start:560 stop:1015 length:456 start_codon:yes stop_codon:yes gene_type:complete
MNREYAIKNDAEWLYADRRDENYSQIVIIPAHQLEESNEANINDYVRSAIPAMKHDLRIVGTVETTEECDDGLRMDGIMLIHDEDIGAFAPARFGLDIQFRWLEDILGNAMERGTQTYNNAFLCAYPPTWTYGTTQWHDYDCYAGTWAVGA